MKKLITILMLCFCLLWGVTACNQTENSSSGDITIASKNFTESDVLAELLAQQIEDTTKLSVKRVPQLGGSFVCHKAIVAGDIDAYVEYTGTAFTAILNQKVINDPQVVYNRVKQAYAKDFNLEVMAPLGFENTFAMIIRSEDAQKYNLQTISDATKYTPQWRGGFGYEFVQREDGLPGLIKTYNLKFGGSPKVMDLGLIYRALTQGLVDMVAGNSTDGQIARLNLVILQDNKKYFPPYQATPVFRQATLKKYPQIKTAMSQLSGKITADEMQRLNYLVEGELRDIGDVVREFRVQKGFA